MLNAILKHPLFTICSNSTSLILFIQLPTVDTYQQSLHKVSHKSKFKKNLKWNCTRKAEALRNWKFESQYFYKARQTSGCRSVINLSWKVYNGAMKTYSDLYFFKNKVLCKYHSYSSYSMHSEKVLGSNPFIVSSSWIFSSFL